MREPAISISIAQKPLAAPISPSLRWSLVSSVIVFALMLAPAVWNGFPLLQYDTGGYIARWYEGYLVPSRSTTYGLFLTGTEGFDFWPAIIIQSALTVWVVTLSLRAFGVAEGLRRRVAIFAILSAVTTLPFLTSILLTDIFAGLGVLSLHLLITRADTLQRGEKIGLFLLVAFATATHSATFAVLLAVLIAGGVASVFVSALIPRPGLVRGGAAVALGAAMLLSTNFALSGRLAWTPGGYGIVFGRMLEDGIVARYLRQYCPQADLKLCPFRNELPPTADEFLWGTSVFNQLGRFAGMEDEMGRIVIGSLAEYPGMQFEAAVHATLRQLALNATGYGVHDKLWHTYGIVERFLPGKVAAMRAARQQKGELNFNLVNRLHVPVAIGSMTLALALIGQGLWRRQMDDLVLFAGMASVAMLANAFVCGALSGPHDRYGSRMVWIATLVVLVAAVRTVRKPAENLSPLSGDRSNPATSL